MESELRILEQWCARLPIRGKFPGRNRAGRAPAPHRLQKRSRGRSEPAVLPLNLAESEHFPHFARIKRVRRHPQRPRCGQAIRLEFETIEACEFADLYESVRPILFAVHFRVAVLPVGSHLSNTGSIGQPCAQPSGTIPSQAIRFFRRRDPLSLHLPEPELIQDPPGTRGDARRHTTKDKTGNPAGCPFSLQTWQNGAGRQNTSPVY